jgi:hypothetical protein
VSQQHAIISFCEVLYACWVSCKQAKIYGNFDKTVDYYHINSEINLSGQTCAKEGLGSVQ